MKFIENIVTVIHSLPDLLQLKPATEGEIADAERQLGVRFADEYKEYLAAFGAVMANGLELTGIAKSEHRNVVALTKREWDLNPKVPHTMYVVENTCMDGVLIWQDTDGYIFRTKPGMYARQIATSLAEYVSNRSK